MTRGTPGWCGLASTVVAVALLVSCSREASEVAVPERQAARKVAIIGVDGATWRVLNPLMRAGELPNLSRLIDQGAKGVLHSVRPIKSPAVWTTIATGVPRAEHGVLDFEMDGRLVSALDRRRSAIWQWVSAFGLEVGFAGWWASWPVDPVRGWFVTDRAVRNRWSEWISSPAAEQTTHPESLSELVRDLSVVPTEMPREQVARIVELNDAEWAEFRAAERPVFQHWLSVFKFAFANQLSYENVSLELLDAGQPDLFSVFLIANDAISHSFWHYYQPERYKGVDEADAARLGQAIPNIARHNDRFLGEVLERVDEETVVVVLSDHGFRAKGRKPTQEPRSRHEEFADLETEGDVVTIGQSGVHHPSGILVLSGPGVLPGTRFEAQLIDVAPTIMALLGLPVADDLHGNVLSAVLDPELVPPAQTVPSYEPLVASSESKEDLELEDPEMLERLRALGYVE